MKKLVINYIILRNDKKLNKYNKIFEIFVQQQRFSPWISALVVYFFKLTGYWIFITVSYIFSEVLDLEFAY